MALHRGIQSAIFYYVSCAPCSDARYRRKRKQEAQADRAQRAALEVEMPNLYRHPSPSSTNPHWQAEIAAGPTLLQRGKRKPNTSDSQRGLKTSLTQSSNGSKTSGNWNDEHFDGIGRDDGRGLFWRYQREDEELWASNTSISHLSQDDSSGVRRPMKARTRDTVEAGFRNPPINELHPAVVTRITSREEAQWMLQPPPVAEIMSGKERVLRSRSGSGGSGRPSSRATGGSLSRDVSRRMMQRKVKNGETPALLSATTMSRQSSSRTEKEALGLGRDGTMTETKDFAPSFDDTPSKKTRRRPSPIQIHVSDRSSDSAITVVRNADLAPESNRKLTQTRRVASRPQLSTISSDNNIPADRQEAFYTPATTPNENILPEPERTNSSRSGSQESRDKTARRSALLVKHDADMKALRSLTTITTDPILNSHILTSPEIARRQDSVRDASLSVQETSSPARRSMNATPSRGTDGIGTGTGIEMFESWNAADFESPTWIHDYTKRDVKQRWSMDF